MKEEGKMLARTERSKSVKIVVLLICVCVIALLVAGVGGLW